MTDQSRKAFEDFIRATPYYAGHTDEDDFLKRSPIVGVDEYVDATIEGAWMAWKAAAERSGPHIAYDCRLGIYGQSFDGPKDRRAYTYRFQPNNDGAYQLGIAARNTALGAGDTIDHGLVLLRELETRGYGVFQIGR